MHLTKFQIWEKKRSFAKLSSSCKFSRPELALYWIMFQSLINNLLYENCSLKLSDDILHAHLVCTCGWSSKIVKSYPSRAGSWNIARCCVLWNDIAVNTQKNTENPVKRQDRSCKSYWASPSNFISHIFYVWSLYWNYVLKY